MQLEIGEYYRINGTKKILYWDGQEWLKPAKDRQGRLGAWLQKIETQPKVKTFEKIDINKIH